MMEQLGKYGHHPDHEIDADVEIERLQGLLCEAHGGLLRALDYRAATPIGLSIKDDVRDALRRTGYTGNMDVIGVERSEGAPSATISVAASIARNRRRHSVLNEDNGTTT